MNLKRNPSREQPISSFSSTEETTKDQQLAYVTEAELFEQLQEDEALFEQHVSLILSTPSYEHLSRQEAEGLVETMFRYATLLYELVTSKSGTPLSEESRHKGMFEHPNNSSEYEK